MIVNLTNVPVRYGRKVMGGSYFMGDTLKYESLSFKGYEVVKGLKKIDEMAQDICDYLFKVSPDAVIIKEVTEWGITLDCQGEINGVVDISILEENEKPDFTADIYED